jgi:hypothetical protein
MITITIPQDMEFPISEEARRLGTTPEVLAVESLRRLFMTVITEKIPENETLFDYLSDYIGTVDGSGEAFSENCGKRFAEGMIRKQQRAHL